MTDLARETSTTTKAIEDKRIVRFISPKKSGTQQPQGVCAIFSEDEKDFLTGSECSPDAKGRLKEIYKMARKMLIQDTEKDIKDNDGEPVTPTIFLNHLQKLDLSKDKDCVIFNLAMYSGIVAPTKAAFNSAVHMFYVEDREAEATEKKKTLKSKGKALEYIESIKDKDINAYFRLITGSDPSLATKSEIEFALLEAADKTPLKVVQIFSDPDLPIRLFFWKLIVNKVIHHDRQNGMFKHDNSPLGTSPEAVILFIKNPDNAPLIAEWAKKLKMPVEDILTVEPVNAVEE